MAIGHVPVRERLVLPKREGVPLAHVLEGDDAFPPDTEAFLFLYDSSDEELAFWPLTIYASTITIDVDGAEWWPYRQTARWFTVFVVYPEEPAKKWPWFDGAVVRTT